MLVLTRKTNESIRIGDEVTVSILEVRGSRVRIGITAPPDVGIAREEVWVPVEAEILTRQALAHQSA